ncbi:MAG TPA: hypothetical protein VGE29_10310 [Prosthecobacter sp.]
MNRTLIIRLGAALLFLVLAKVAWDRMMRADDGMKLVYFIALGAGVGFLFVKYVLPWFGDKVGTLVFSSGEEVRQDAGLRAAAKLAQGDYEGAIAEHEKTLAKDPAQTFPAAEIAKICAEKLHDPQRSLQVLLKHQASRAWAEDDAAFLRFRIAELHATHLHDLASARSVLEQIIADFPNTRHSANANHKVHELEQAEYKQMMEQRTRKSGPDA